MRRTLLAPLFLLSACTAQVGDLDDLEVIDEACDPRGGAVRGTDLDLQFDGLTPHRNQDILFAVTVGERRNIEGMMVLSGLDDPDLHLVVPKLLPEGPSELAFWADADPVGVFNGIPDEDEPPANVSIDHQWTRPICPNGVLTFKHTTPFQSVRSAVSTGAIFQFVFPELVRERSQLFSTFKMWVRATQLDDEDPEKEVQTRAFFRWSPRVEDPATGETPPQRLPTNGMFQVGGNVIGESRGAIDKGSLYNIEFVIDVDDDGEVTGEDFVCLFERERAPDSMTWAFEPDLSVCDFPDGFDPRTFERQR